MARVKSASGNMEDALQVKCFEIGEGLLMGFHVTALSRTKSLYSPTER